MLDTARNLQLKMWIGFDLEKQSTGLCSPCFWVSKGTGEEIFAQLPHDSPVQEGWDFTN